MSTQLVDAAVGSWVGQSPFAVKTDLVDQEWLVSEGRVRYLIVHGELDRGGTGIVGAIWISVDGNRGGFVRGFGATWSAGEMARSHKGALDRGWTHDRIFRFWNETPGELIGITVADLAEAESLRKLVNFVEGA